MKPKEILIKTSLLSIFLSFCACGGGGGDNSTAVSTLPPSGQLVDSYVEGVDYTCADGTHSTTTQSGFFQCKKLPVTFAIGGIRLGQMTNIPIDKQIFPQDLLALSRDDINNTNVIAMARFLQSCDDDNNTDNGILIQATLKEKFQNYDENFNPENLYTYAYEANLTLIDEQTALIHLQNSLDFVNRVDASTVPQYIKDALLSPKNILNQTVKNTLSFMGNEERLAHDLYLNLYNYHLTTNSYEIKQLNNIATNSETAHIQTVQLLINKYITNPDEFTNIDLPELNYSNTDIEDMNMGTYDISEIQDLYNTLYDKGIMSPQDALEVGCMVEVTDVNDLLVDIAQAEENNDTDIATAFTFLQDGSYNHYWAFDKGLKNMGIEEGCCSLGTEYCHPEYPQSERGSKRY